MATLALILYTWLGVGAIAGALLTDVRYRFRLAFLVLFLWIVLLPWVTSYSYL